MEMVKKVGVLILVLSLVYGCGNPNQSRLALDANEKHLVAMSEQAMFEFYYLAAAANSDPKNKVKLTGEDFEFYLSFFGLEITEKFRDNLKIMLFGGGAMALVGFYTAWKTKGFLRRSGASLAGLLGLASVGSAFSANAVLVKKKEKREEIIREILGSRYGGTINKYSKLYGKMLAWLPADHLEFENFMANEVILQVNNEVKRREASDKSLEPITVNLNLTAVDAIIKNKLASPTRLKNIESFKKFVSEVNEFFVRHPIEIKDDSLKDDDIFKIKFEELKLAQASVKAVLKRNGDSMNRKQKAYLVQMNAKLARVSRMFEDFQRIRDDKMLADKDAS